MVAYVFVMGCDRVHFHRRTRQFIDELASGKPDKAEDWRGTVIARARDADMDFNIYFCKTDFALATATLESRQANGIDANSKAIDPMFVDPENGDFRFQPDSPALKMGIIPIDLSKIGLRTPADGLPSKKPNSSE